MKILKWRNTTASGTQLSSSEFCHARGLGFHLDLRISETGRITAGGAGENISTSVPSAV
jgi:hypothetical protein